MNDPTRNKKFAGTVVPGSQLSGLRGARNHLDALRLADWPANFDRTLRQLLAFIELPYDPTCTRFHEVGRDVQTASRSQVREPVHGRGLGRWRGHSA